MVNFLNFLNIILCIAFVIFWKFLLNQDRGSGFQTSLKCSGGSIRSGWCFIQSIVMNGIHNILQTKAFCMKTKKFFLLRTLILTNPANNMAVLVVETFAT